MDNTIKTILYSWKDKKIPEIIPREVELEGYLKMTPRKIVAITGFRRVGKTYILYSLIKKLLKEYSREEVIYINFDDERIPESTEFLTNLVPAIKETFSEPRYLLLDEIQNMPHWSKWLRRIYDNESVNIFITGSSSKVSSRELPTELRGRSLEIKVHPLSFTEFLRFKNINVNYKDAEYSESTRTVILRALNEYLTYGGMPEVVLADESKKFEILQDYFRTVLSRDIIERFNVGNEEGIKALLKLLLNSTNYSISKLYNTLKSMGYHIGKTTVLNYLGYIESSYFIHSIPIFSYKIKDQMQYPRKVYIIDNGFISSISTKFSKDMGRLYENMVAVELLRRGSKDNFDVFYWKDQRGKEVDFVIRNDLKIEQLIQVSYDVSDYDTKKREVTALIKASDALNCENLLVINSSYDAVEEIKGKKIVFVPLWKWLLGM